MNFYQNICNNVILPFSDLVSGMNVQGRLNEIKKFQWLPKHDIEKYQKLYFKKLINLIVNSVPFYQSYFYEKRLSIEDFHNLDDLKKLPIITKDILKNNFEHLKISNYSGKTYEMKSSGSTGEQTTVLVDKNVNEEVFSTQLLFWSWGGFFMGAPHLQTGMSLKRGIVKYLKDLIFLCSYRSAFELSDDAIEKIIKTIKHKNIKYLFGYASSIFLIAKYIKNCNMDIRLHKIFIWGDCLFPHYRILIEEVFSCKVSDCYGLGEGLQVACQCEMNDSLHIAEHHVIVEIMDSSYQRSCNDNEIGKVIVTRLMPGPMPLLRYDTGDIASFIPGVCDCGRSLRMLTRIQGRDTDIIRSPKGDRLIVHFFTQIFEMIPEIKQFQVRQSHLEAIDILYIPDNGFGEELLKRIQEQIHDNCKYKFKINFKKVDDIPLEKSNKRRFVISSFPL